MKTLNIREIRRATGLNQHQFWSALGVTQSGGSRYENGRNVPRTVQALVNVTYVHKIDLSKITAANADAVRALLAGKLEPMALQQTAEEVQALLASASQLGERAISLAQRVRVAGTEEHAA